MRKLRSRLESQVWCWELTARGVRIGRDLTVSGRPIVSGARFGNLELGDRVELVSDPRRTNLGVRSPAVLRLLTQGSELVIGEDTGISGGVLCAAASVRIGARCLIGADVMIFDTDFHALEPEGRRYGAPVWAEVSAPVVIGDDVFIGTRSTITKGVTIGHGASIGAGSVVTSDIPAYSVAAGVPAKVIRSIRSE